jgi:hypothetical protein
MHDVLTWLKAHSHLLWWLAALSAVMFVLTLVLVPVIVVRIPSDYFLHKTRPRIDWLPNHRLLRGLVIVGKNLLGALLFLVGIAMLVLPGQGILTMLIGLMLMDFPSTYRLERWLVRQGPTLRGINWMRARAKQAPLEMGS